MRLFVSYRRDDSEGYVGTLSLALEQSQGRPPVDLFVDSNKIPGGANFVRVILDALESCDAVLVCIGPDWRGSAGASQLPRIFDENDKIRLELRTAFSSGIPVFAALVNGAALPQQKDIPPDLAKLSAIPFINLTDQHFERDVAEMADYIRSIVKPPERAAAAPAVLSVTVPPGIYFGSVEMRVDGKAVGRFMARPQRPAAFPLEPGTHTIQIKDGLWKTNRLSVKAEPGRKIEVLYVAGFSPKLTIIE